MTRLGTVLYDRSASFELCAVLEVLAGLFAELSTYAPQQLWAMADDDVLDEWQTEAARMLALGWRRKVARLHASRANLDDRVLSQRFKFDMTTVLRDLETDVLRTPGPLLDRAMRAHARLESAFTTLAGTAGSDEARSVLEALAEAERNEQIAITSLARELTTRLEEVGAPGLAAGE